MIVIRSERLRCVIRHVVPFVVVPALALSGAVLAERGQYALVISLACAASFLLFAAGFERRKTGARRLVVASVMTALAVAGRFIPLVKPVAALTIISALYLGGEAGFLTGALTALISNFYFGQGPWTPFQMMAWGLVGLIAGLLAAPLRKSRALLLIYGLLSGVGYSMIMDVWTVLWYGQGFNMSLYLAALVTALPHTALYAASNVIYLALFARPFGEKLERLRVKYGV